MILNLNVLSKLLKTNKILLKDRISINKLRFISYRYPTELEKIKIIKKILSKISLDKQIINSKDRKKVWYKGWNENKNEFFKNKKEINLIPKYYSARNEKIFRLGGQFVISDKKFELKFLELFREWYVNSFFKKYKNIYEFGTGSGHNLIAINKILKNKNLYGLDFVKPSVDLVNSFKKKFKINVNAMLFDMQKPNYKFKIKNDSIVFTKGSLEQLGGKVENFIDYLIKNKPNLVMHSEPMPNFYNPNSLADLTGLIFHNKRKYTSNLFETLLKKEKQKKIKIIKHFKSPFGSLMMEGYNFVLWKPL